MATKLLTLGDWCITSDEVGLDGAGLEWIYADHLKCLAVNKAPVVVGDLCWVHNDSEPLCFYCHEAVPAEVQAIVLLRMKVNEALT